MDNYVIEMLNIRKEFPGIVANDDITLRLKKGEIHALLGENGAGKSTLMSVLFGIYQAEAGEIKKNGENIEIKNPNDANHFGIGMVHQHFMLVEVFTVLENIILGDEPQKRGFLAKKEARNKIITLSKKYGLQVDPDALIENITVGQQQRVEILKMLYRDNDILIFDEPTAVLTPQEIDDLMTIMRGFAKEGKSILFITHKLNEIKAVADRCTVLRKGKYIGTVDVKNTTKEELSKMMVGRSINFNISKKVQNPGDMVLNVENVSIKSEGSDLHIVKNVSFDVKAGEIVCLAGIEGNGQSELIKAITGLEKIKHGKIELNHENITKAPIRKRSKLGMSHVPEDRQKYGLILDYSLEKNMILQLYWQKPFQKYGVLKPEVMRTYSEMLIDKYDVRSGQGPITLARSMSGGNQQKAIIARELEKQCNLLVCVQPTRGLDVGAIEFIHKEIIAARDAGKGVLLMSLELDEVLDLSDRILVMYEGEITGELDPKHTTPEELGLYMSGAKRQANTEVTHEQHK